MGFLLLLRLWKKKFSNFWAPCRGVGRGNKKKILPRNTWGEKKQHGLTSFDWGRFGGAWVDLVDLQPNFLQKQGVHGCTLTYDLFAQ